MVFYEKIVTPLMCFGIGKFNFMNNKTNNKQHNLTETLSLITPAKTRLIFVLHQWPSGQQACWSGIVGV